MPNWVIGNTKINIEVPLLLYFFATSFSDSIRMNLIVFRTCYVTLGYNRSECALLGSKHFDNETAKLEKIVQSEAYWLNLMYLIIDRAFSACICSFVGPWSDRFGRRLVLLIPVIGYSLYYLLLIAFAKWDTLSHWYFFICSIPLYLTGGGSTYLTVLLCYVTDLSEEENKGVKMGIFETIMSCGFLFGTLSNSYTFSAIGYEAVFLISSLCLVVNFFFTLFLVPESAENPELEGRLKGLFEITNVIEMGRVTFKKRRNYDRFIVLCSILMLGVFILVTMGDDAVDFLLVREKFNWSLQQYTILSAIHSTFWVFGSLIGTCLLHKWLKFPESVMALLGFLSMCFGMSAMGLAQYDWHVYAAFVSRCLGAVIRPMVRSLMSRIVPEEEIGKVFAMLVVFESVLGIAGPVIFTAIYNATISTDPAIFNFVGAGFYGVEILLAIGVIVARRMGTSDMMYEEIETGYDAEESRDEAEA